MRFDDTNPEKEDKEYVDGSIIDAVRWWASTGQSNFNGKNEPPLLRVSNYFDFMYRAAEYLIDRRPRLCGRADAEEMRVNRGDFGKSRRGQPFRTAPLLKTCTLSEMRDGQLADGAAVLRAKIDMAPTSTCATRPSTASAAPSTTTRATPGASTPCTPLRTPSRTRWSKSPQHLHAGI